MDFLIEGVEQKEWQAWKFTALVETLRKADKQTLLKLWEHCHNDDKHRCLLEFVSNCMDFMFLNVDMSFVYLFVISSLHVPKKSFKTF